MEAISARSTNYNKTENGTSIVPKGEEVDKDIFLKMLVAQMVNQDPFNSQDPTEYITQLAQFTMLDHMMSLNDSMEYLVGVNNGILVNTAMSTASSLIDKHIEVKEFDEDGTEISGSGVVKSTFIKDGIVYLEVKLDDSEEIKSFRYESLVKINSDKENK
ncbi:flagellar biosynthesis protein FlgD [Romboutsia weinsteinii]|uniref:Flagellar biosynthesis protein FlgD n=1 Tax=Romboutsia weinsteinii TaxID=2020949 RepID=A0A371J841_9FIRM|nr:flagellar hook capping FlgD N-terminal domain-containing protein [Romboutsia weinsteinii]RDY28929.1 flagellar biosynthesis protein FlgD [Romboutsia weinsteinii]